MRVGSNPEKNKKGLIRYKFHRVIIPVYIPNDQDSYFENLFHVFKLSISSLLNSIDLAQTDITIINNNCNHKVTNFIYDLLNSKKIDKHVHYTRNLGKVNTILSEVKGCYEDFVTIADADVFYFDGWQKHTFDVFTKVDKVGVVAPLPCTHLEYYNNISFFSNIFKTKKKRLLITKESCELFGKSVGWPKERVLKEKRWESPQYFIKKNNTEVCLGAGHFVATYRSDILRILPFKKNTYVFKNGDEHEFLDEPIDKLGYYRVSLPKPYVYHLGNTIPNWVDSISYKIESLDSFQLPKLKVNIIPFVVRIFTYKLWRKLNRKK